MHGASICRHVWQVGLQGLVTTQPGDQPGPTCSTPRTTLNHTIYAKIIRWLDDVVIKERTEGKQLNTTRTVFAGRDAFRSRKDFSLAGQLDETTWMH
jgi:hypothetical protein